MYVRSIYWYLVEILLFERSVSTRFDHLEMHVWNCIWTCIYLLGIMLKLVVNYVEHFTTVLSQTLLCNFLVLLVLMVDDLPDLSQFIFDMS